VAHLELLQATMATEQALGLQFSLLYALLADRMSLHGRTPLPDPADRP
jgi:hypothetical protein